MSLAKSENKVTIHHLHVKRFHMVKRLWKSVQYIRRYSTKYAEPREHDCCVEWTDLQLWAGYTLGFAMHFSSFFLLWAKLSQYLLDRFSRLFHQMEGICVNFVDPVQFFRFLEGRCQIVSLVKHKPRVIFTPYESVLGADDRSDIFSISQGTLPWQPILRRSGLVRSEPKYLRIRWTDFHNLCIYIYIV